MVQEEEEDTVSSEDEAVTHRHVFFKSFFPDVLMIDDCKSFLGIFKGLHHQLAPSLQRS